MSASATARKGDLLVTVEVLVPQALNEQAREALNSYAEAVGSVNPRAKLFAAGRGVTVSASELPQRIDHDAPVFVISVAAHLAGMHPQTLRTYDRMGLVLAAAYGQARSPLLGTRHRASSG